MVFDKKNIKDDGQKIEFEGVLMSKKDYEKMIKSG